MPITVVFVTEIISRYQLTTVQKSNNHMTLPCHLPKVVLSFLRQAVRSIECCGCWISALRVAESKEMIVVTNAAIEQALLACLIISYKTLHQSAMLHFPTDQPQAHYCIMKITRIKPNTVPSGGFHLIIK